MITYISTLGVFISENLLNLFTFFEIMSLSSYPLIIHDEDDTAHEAGSTYISMAVGGGLVLLMGIFILYANTASLDITYISENLTNLGDIKYVISVLMIIGFGVKAGMVPLHIWLPKAHPAAPTPASAVLSALLVKTGIYGIIITIVFLMKGDLYLSILLVISGFINMIVGGILALHQIDIKKTLAYSSMSQLGYLILGIGLIGLSGEFNTYAVIGTLYHVFNHAIFKAMLFMGVGIIYMITHKLDINKIYGFGTFKPILKITFFVGFCAIIGLPGFNGFASKTLLHHALSEVSSSYGLFFKYFGEFLFYLSGALTTAYLLKLYITIFVENNSRYYASYRKYINKRALFPMVISSFLIIYIGIKPNLFVEYFENVYKIFNLHHEDLHHLHFYTFESILSSITTIGIGILIYKNFILKKLRVKGIEHDFFINNTTSWFSLEKNIYVPFSNYFYNIIHISFKFLDNIISWFFKILASSYNQLANIEPINPITLFSSKRKSFKIKQIDIKAKIDKLEKPDILSKPMSNTLSKDFKEMHAKFNTITYSIYFLGAFIVLVLLSVIIFKK
jgi:formate hydrogenlyase subunit 3/multisubunit Na+/H+ antiporter MnhD subunit